jgi:hypothetical protein
MPCLCFSSGHADADCRTPVHRVPPPPATLCPTAASSSSNPRRCTSTTLPAPAPTTPPSPHRCSSPLDARHRGHPALASLWPSRPHPEHHAAEYDLPTPRAVDHHPWKPAPTAIPLRPTTPRRRARSSSEDLHVPTPHMGAPHCQAAP